MAKDRALKLMQCIDVTGIVAYPDMDITRHETISGRNAARNLTRTLEDGGQRQQKIMLECLMKLKNVEELPYLDQTSSTLLVNFDFKDTIDKIKERDRLLTNQQKKVFKFLA